MTQLEAVVTNVNKCNKIVEADKLTSKFGRSRHRFFNSLTSSVHWTELNWAQGLDKKGLVCRKSTI